MLPPLAWRVEQEFRSGPEELMTRNKCLRHDSGRRVDHKLRLFEMSQALIDEADSLMDASREPVFKLRELRIATLRLTQCEQPSSSDDASETR
jgi:hypothetical protein